MGFALASRAEKVWLTGIKSLAHWSCLVLRWLVRWSYVTDNNMLHYRAPGTSMRHAICKWLCKRGYHTWLWCQVSIHDGEIWCPSLSTDRRRCYSCGLHEKVISGTFYWCSRGKDGFYDKRIPLQVEYYLPPDIGRPLSVRVADDLRVNT
jgi:hypothetical protein